MTRPALFLHGGTVGGWSWEPQRRAFDDRPVLAPDLPGYLSRRDEPWADFDSVVDRLATFLDRETTEPVDVVGLSLGGITALHFAARHPRRVASVFVTGASVLPYPAVDALGERGVPRRVEPALLLGGNSASIRYGGRGGEAARGE